MIDTLGKSLAIIIINYKTPQLVINCLGSLLPELSGLDVKVVIVDNFSNDDSFEKIGKFSSYSVLTSPPSLCGGSISEN